MANQPVLIEVRDLTKYYPLRRNLFRRVGKGVIKAVDGLSFQIQKGRSLGIAGESGCGKTTMGRLLLRLIRPTSGSIFFNGEDINALMDPGEQKAFRRQAQLMFQNPYEALNPRLTIFRSIMEPLIIHGNSDNKENERRTSEALECVNLSPVENYRYKFPHQMSGGQLQRVVLARSLVLEPSFLVADEPVSMLDVSVRAGVLNLMKTLSQSMNLTTMYISHDLSLIQYMCEETAIMYLGRIVERGDTSKILGNPLHPYTQALIAAIPTPDPDAEQEEVMIKDSIPNPVNLPPGCLFQNRCYKADDVCRKESPELTELSPNHFAACFKIETERR